ncbi:MAG: CrcB family protein [Dactylosporangium sp.]|nr:CrcB family protein [Dactylosporangium sp.]NNJ60487.1 CrcB family protein [Dactylosporangium sp.]
MASAPSKASPGRARTRPASRRPTRGARAPRDVLAVISAGGMLGAVARFVLGAAFPAEPGMFPWATFGVNVLGGLLIGTLMVLVNDVWTERRLLRPFLSVGVLGGFTTFSTYVVDVHQLVETDAPGTGLAYLFGTVVAVLAATCAGIAGARRALRWWGATA